MGTQLTVQAPGYTGQPSDGSRMTSGWSWKIPIKDFGDGTIMLRSRA
jgi:hypothetical protein